MWGSRGSAALHSRKGLDGPECWLGHLPALWPCPSHLNSKPWIPHLEKADNITYLRGILWELEYEKLLSQCLTSSWCLRNAQCYLSYTIFYALCKCQVRPVAKLCGNTLRNENVFNSVWKGNFCIKEKVAFLRICIYFLFKKIFLIVQLSIKTLADGVSLQVFPLFLLIRFPGWAHFNRQTQAMGLLLDTSSLLGCFWGHCLLFASASCPGLTLNSDFILCLTQALPPRRWLSSLNSV